jgi:hypothetical protein
MACFNGVASARTCSGSMSSGSSSASGRLRAWSMSAAHDHRRDGEEMSAVLQVDVFRPCQPKERLVDQGRRLQGVTGPLLAEAAGRDGVQLRHQAPRAGATQPRRRRSAIDATIP